MELRIVSPEKESDLKPIEFNFEELKQEIKLSVEKYQNLVYDETAIKSAKEDRARLNKFKDALDTKRKEVKNFYLKHYEAFEKQIKELIALVDEPIQQIDGQIKSYEEKLRSEKMQHAGDIYEGSAGSLTDLIPFEKVKSLYPKWGNQTCGLKDICNDIDILIARVGSDLKAIESLKSERELEIKTHYFRSLNLADALRVHEQMERERKRVEDREAALKNQRVVAPSPDPKSQPNEPTPAQAEAESLQEMAFRVWATREQLQALKKCLVENKIKYGRV